MCPFTTERERGNRSVIAPRGDVHVVDAAFRRVGPPFILNVRHSPCLDYENVTRAKGLC